MIGAPSPVALLGLPLWPAPARDGIDTTTRLPARVDVEREPELAG